MQEYNHDLCLEMHKSIDKRLDEGTKEMERIRHILFGNGMAGYITRLDKIETIIARQESLFWRLAQPALPILYGVILAGLYAKYGG